MWQAFATQAAGSMFGGESGGGTMPGVTTTSEASVGNVEFGTPAGMANLAGFRNNNQTLIIMAGIVAVAGVIAWGKRR